MADLTKLSDADLVALKSGDITKLSDAGLLALKGQGSTQVMPATKPLTRDNPNPIDNVLTDVIAWKMRNVDPKLPSFLRTTDPQASIPGRIVQGAADLPVGTMQLAANAAGLGDKVNSQIASTNQRTEQLRGPDAGFDFARLTGNLINPAPYSLAAKIPAATMAGKVGQGTVLGTVTGATTPVSKGNFWDEKATQTAVGAGVGAAVPVAIAAVKMVGGKAVDVADLLRPGGPQRIFEKYQNNIIGADEASRQRIIDALRKVEEYVPGSKPTVAEALESVPQASPLVSYQQSLAAAPGGPSGAFGQRMADQKAARRAALQTVGKTEAELNAAIKDRSDTAREMYGGIRDRRVSSESDLQLMQNAIDNRFQSKASALQDQGRFQTFGAQQENLANNWMPVPGQPRISSRYAPQTENVAPAQSAAKDAGWIAKYRQNEKEFLESTLENLRNTVGMSDKSLTELLKRPSMQAAVKDAITSAAERGTYFPSAGQKFSVENLQRIKEALDSGVRAASNAEKNGRRPELSVSELEGTRKSFVNWLSNRVPEWGEARSQYAADSKVIDRMRVGQSLQDKLVSATGKETPAQFAGAIRNEVQSIKRATGESRYQDLAELLTPQENTTVQNVLADVSRKARSFQQPQHTNLYGGLNVAEQNAPKLPNMLNTGATITNRLLKGLSDKTEKQIEKLATEVYLNPSKLADILEKAPISQRKSLLDLLRPYAITSPLYAAQGQ